MAEGKTARRKPAGQLTWLWMIFAIALTGGLMVWLAVASEPSAPVVVKEEDGTAAAGLPTVALADFAANTKQYEGQAIRLAQLRVASRLGRQAFWIQLPNDVPYLIKLDSILVRQGFQVQGGDAVSVTGVVHPMSDSVLTAWQAQGALTTEDQKVEAQFATSFIEASRVVRLAAAE